MPSNWEIPDNPGRPFPYTPEQLDAIFAELAPIEARSEGVRPQRPRRLFNGDR